MIDLRKSTARSIAYPITPKQKIGLFGRLFPTYDRGTRRIFYLDSFTALYF